MQKRILVVDDLAQIRKLIRDSLEAETEFRICGEATDGYDAIEKAQRLKPDLIILDVSTPRMSGIEAAPKIEADPFQYTDYLFMDRFSKQIAKRMLSAAAGACC
jgi:chemotaxis response regulator CheB